ncbi:polyamine-transporting ATPase 13A3-like isoform X2 [Ischnura elegans]|uniref:polyamine-transporting ATPase 13A3-like isoform X2 n=1 Tax=Ischnura elegans TaxID=197161 RepID=UPI001ED88191|nr:polyamine-transporting ATPase 13A3-like isoform X2 [Ischnura elegans]
MAPRLAPMTAMGASTPEAADGRRHAAGGKGDAMEGEGAGMCQNEVVDPCNGAETTPPGVHLINPGDEDQMQIYGYRPHMALKVLTWAAILVTGGVLRLIFHWWPHWMLYATHSQCHLSSATSVLCVEKFQKKYTCYHVKKVVTLSAKDAELNVDESGKTMKKGAKDKGRDGSNGVNGDAEEAATQDVQVLTELKEPDALEGAKLSLHLKGGIFKEMEAVRTFRCKKLTYVWDAEQEEFIRLTGLDGGVSPTSLHCHSGLSFKEQCLRRVVYGLNEIAVPVHSVIALLFLEVLNPFYVFQIFSFCLWFADEYIYYALAIFIMSAASITLTIIQTRKNQRNLRGTVASSDVATVVRAIEPRDATGEVLYQHEMIPTEQLVPGDVIIVPLHGCIMPCDAVLLSGNCIVNESMLTGESVPVTKTPLPFGHGGAPSVYDPKDHARHTLFCGTRVIQTRYYEPRGVGKVKKGEEGTASILDRVRAVVVRTGFLTAKGQLVRSIMYPPPVDFRFERDSYRFVAGLAGVAAIGFVYTVISKTLRGVEGKEIALDSLDLVTIVVPPALPAAMTVGRLYAQARLKEKGIFCISPRTINVSGAIDCVCFDKTGTLTEDGLDMWGIVPVAPDGPMGGGDERWGESEGTPGEASRRFELPVKSVDRLPICDPLLVAMTACHSITIIDGKLCGDPLDLKMFESTGWIIEEPEVDDTSKFDLIFPTVVKPAKPDILSGHSSDIAEEEGSGCPPIEVGIVRQFPFSSGLQRMSVVTRTLGSNHFNVFCKGSPEMILSLSKPETVPPDFGCVLHEYTRQGYRVLAIGGKRVSSRISYTKVQRWSREDAENSLTLLGLIVMENRLKPETSGIIGMLRDACIRTIMVTGDNMLTALSVARDCGMVPANTSVVVVNAVAGSSEDGKEGKPRLYYTLPDSSSSVPSYTPHHERRELSTRLDGHGEGDRKGPSRKSNTNHIPGDKSLDLEMGLSNCGGVRTLEKQMPVVLAATGRTWDVVREHFREAMARLCVRGVVFARMSPDQKQQLVQELQTMGYSVGMCGDGANDCGALKAAHAGISLSEAESSVASPFTSTEPNISCVPRVIREGRAALVTSVGVFKYMAAYSLAQFVSVMLLQSIESNLTDTQFLYIDLFLITLSASFFGRTEAAEGGPLSPQAPLASLLSAPPIISLAAQVITVIIAQTAVFIMTQSDVFSHLVTEATFNGTTSPSEIVDSHGNSTSLHEYEDVEWAPKENYAVFTVSMFQYIILAAVFSKGAPHRKSLPSNRGLLISLAAATVCSVVLTLCPPDWLAASLQLRIPSSSIPRLISLGVAFANLIIAIGIETLVDHMEATATYPSRMWCRGVSEPRHAVIQREIEEEGAVWPPISREAVVQSPGTPPSMQPPPMALRVELVSENSVWGPAISYSSQHSSTPDVAIAP